jgi:hypothetical protein
MPNKSKLLLIYVLQIIPLLIYPPETLKSGLIIVGIMIVVFALLGYGLWRGRTWALSLSLTMQGFNVIARLMMLFPNSLISKANGVFGFDFLYIALGVVSIALSLYFLLRLDRPDVRATIIS